MRKYNSIQVEQQQLATVTCNKCGASFPRDDVGLPSFSPHVHIEHQWSYGSQKDTD